MKNFELLLKIKHLSVIKPREGGDSKIDGQAIKWGFAVKIKVRNIDTVPDEKFGEKEVESTLEIEIPCSSLSETMRLNNLLVLMKSNKKEFDLKVGLAQKGKDSFVCKSLENASEFLEKHRVQTKV